MKAIQLLLTCSLLLVLFSANAGEAKTPEIIDTIKPFEFCAPASIHAQEALNRISKMLDYQGEAITLCRSITIPTLAAWSKLLRMEQHPYVNWKKLPITKPYINYNPLYLEQVEEAQGEVIAYALLARQVGHHIKEHPNYQTPLAGLDPSPAHIAIADYFAGVVLAKLSLSAEQLGQAQNIIFNLAEYPEVTILEQRQKLLLQGWVKAGGEATTLPNVALTQRW